MNAGLTREALGFNMKFHVMRLCPANIQVIGSEIAIRWNDDSETFFPLEDLRKACPCAGCGGEPDVLGRDCEAACFVHTASFRLRSYQIVGGYAFQPFWEDGHNTGLYSFPFLKKLEAGVGGKVD